MYASVAHFIAAGLTAGTALTPAAPENSAVHAMCIDSSAVHGAASQGRGTEADSAGHDVLIIVAHTDVEAVRVILVDDDGNILVDTISQGRTMHLALPPGTCARLR